MDQINYAQKLDNYEKCKEEIFKLLDFLPNDAMKETYWAGCLKKILML